VFDPAVDEEVDHVIRPVSGTSGHRSSSQDVVHGLTGPGDPASRPTRRSSVHESICIQ
jgi:hypothetical protein